MTKELTKKVKFCDGCGEEDSYPYACLACGKEFCYECRKKLAVEYAHAVSFAGSGDGVYCNGCDAALRATGTDKLHSAYLKIATLRQEYVDWDKDFGSRRQAAEKHLQKLLPKRLR